MGVGCGYNRGMSTEYAPPGHGGPQPNGNQGGRPRIEFTLDDVAYLCSIDCDEAECAAALGVAPSTLRYRMIEWGERDFPRFRAVKQAAGRAQLRKQLHELARGGPLAQSKASLAALPANIWLSKQRLGYSDRSERRESSPVQILIVGSVESQQLVRGLAGKVLDVPAHSDRVVTEDSDISSLTPYNPPLSQPESEGGKT